VTGLQPDRVEPTARRIRVRLGDRLVADSTRALLLIQYGPGGLPTYFVPRDDVTAGALAAEKQDSAGQASWDVCAGKTVAVDGAWTHAHPDLAGYVTFSWRQLEWYEEDEPVFVHARDPYKRIDVLRSSRTVEIRVGGEVVAKSVRPVLLFETSLPTRYYLPFTDVRPECLEPSDTVSTCPYKGRARYWSVRAGGVLVPDAAWSYPDPIPENPKIRDLVCFFTERVELVLDGIPRPRTVSPWSDSTADVIDEAAWR
jgi:uncharacterized protein (DUF427 family)